MLYFENDYCEGAHPAILQKLTETNMVQTVGYGNDAYCAGAKAKIRAACQAPEADVYTSCGGTQTNTIVIAAILQRWQGVLAAASGHINCHEAGAIEYTGHKVITLPTHEGKITRCQQVRGWWIATFYDDATTSTWCSPAWCISLTPPRAAPCTPRRSWKALSLCARSTTCRCSWTAHAWATA